MEQLMIDTLVIMGAYTVWIALIFGAMNALTLGFLGTYLKVRVSLGRKVLVKINGMTHYYYRTGVIKDGFLSYASRKGEDKLISIDGKSVGRSMAINFVGVDEETNAVIKPDLSVVSGFDAVKISNYIKRALQAPRLESNNDRYMLILLVVILFAVVGLGFMVFQQGEILATLQNAGGVVGNTIQP